MDRKQALEQAIESAGGVSALARKLGVKRERVQKWRTAGEVPLRWVVPVSVATGVARYSLAPELYE